VFDPIDPIGGNLYVMIAGKRSVRPILIMSMVAPGKPAKDKFIPMPLQRLGLKHRLVNQVEEEDNRIVFLQARYHYEDSVDRKESGKRVESG
jgi:hypothetical protein